MITSHAFETSTAVSEHDVAGKRVCRFLNRLLGHNIPPSDISQHLKDGVLLCESLNVVRPGCIPKISRRPLSFLQMENICNFLKALSKEFGIHESDLFSILDLYEARDMRRVIRTILLFEKAYIRELKATGIAHTSPIPQTPSPLKAGTVSTGVTNASSDEQLVMEFVEKQTGQRIHNFKEDLENGVLLCKIMNALVPHAIPVVHTKTSPFYRMENINNFLKAAKAFGLCQNVLFHPDDLLEGKNVHLVFVTILALAQQSGSLGTLGSRWTSTFMSMHSSKGSTVRRSVGDHDLARVVEHLTKRSTSSLISSRQGTPVKPFRSSRNDLPPIEDDLRGFKLTVRQQDQEFVYQIGNCIGRGHFGTVYKGLNISNGEMVAIKRIPIDESTMKETNSIMNEVDLLKSLDHPNIVKYEGFLQQDKYLNIILEFVENGSLYHTLKQFGAFPENLVLYYVVGILHGLCYLHGRNVIHRDLKAANILTTKDGIIKLSDFGVSKEVDFNEKDTTVAGTPNWMAPEIIERRGACKRSDIWSLGCTVLELLTGRPPFADCNPMTVLFRIVEDEYPAIPDSVSADLRSFLLCCFKRDPSERWEASQLLQHDWITKHAASLPVKPETSVKSVDVVNERKKEEETKPVAKKAKYLKRRRSKDSDKQKCLIN